jgi:2-polyprenyl-3-methyl-5-hydroxy-6-metoxy-1,4-benzoquinol methylase
VSSFDPEQFWNERLRDDYSLSGVGWQELRQEFNRWMYRTRRDVFLRHVGRVLSNDRQLSVLDVGAGTGFYIDLWHKLGVSDISAADISDFAVEQLRERYPGMTVSHLDISKPEVLDEFQRRFDAVSAMDVLFHVIDDDAYTRAVGNLAGMVKPGGILLLTETFARDRLQNADHNVFRSRELVESLLREAGMVPVASHPTFILLNEPLNSRNRALHWWWERATRMAKFGPRTAGLVGAGGYALESVALRLFPRFAPSTELVIWRKS